MIKYEYFYEISTTNNGKLGRVARCERLPLAGDILVVKQTFATPGHQVYNVGDELHLMKRTWDAPFGALSSLGNWVAISKYGASVWSNIEWSLATGLLAVDLPA